MSRSHSRGGSFCPVHRNSGSGPPRAQSLWKLSSQSHRLHSVVQLPCAPLSRTFKSHPSMSSLSVRGASQELRNSVGMVAFPS